MSGIVLVAETGSDIPAKIAENYGIYLVPMHVSFGNKTLDDGSFPAEHICEYYQKTKEMPKTSGCSPADFTKVFDEIRSRWPEKHILHLAYSAITTTSYQSAVLTSSTYEPGTITSIDTKQVSVGQAAVVLELAQILEAVPNLPLQKAIQITNKLCSQVHMGFLPDDLEYLRAGGRVSNVAYMGSRILSLHPCIEIIDGSLVATKKYRGRLSKIVPNFICEYAKKHNFNKDRLYLIRSVGLDEAVIKIAETQARECGFQKISWLSTGCVITTHGGPGTFGIVGFSDYDIMPNKNEGIL